MSNTGLWGRCKFFLKAKFSKILDRAEDPAETLEHAYQQQLDNLQDVKQGIAQLVTAKKRLQLQSDKLEAQVAKHESQARAALQAGQEDLARVALQRKMVVQHELGSIDAQVAELEGDQAKLIENEAKLRTKIEQFKTKKEVIKAQYSAAEAQVRISNAATGMGDQMAQVGLAIQRVQDKTENMKARAAAVEELERAGAFDDTLSIGSGGDDIDRKFSELTADAALSSEMDRLRSELGIVAPEAAKQVEAAPTPGAEPTPAAAPAGTVRQG